MPAIDSQSIDMGVKRASTPTWPKSTRRMKNSGTPMGTVIAIAWLTVPFNTPRRVVALFRAKLVAASRDSNAPSNRVPPRVLMGASESPRASIAAGFPAANLGREWLLDAPHELVVARAVAGRRL